MIGDVPVDSIFKSSSSQYKVGDPAGLLNHDFKSITIGLVTSLEYTGSVLNDAVCTVSANCVTQSKTVKVKSWVYFYVLSLTTLVILNVTGTIMALRLKLAL